MDETRPCGRQVVPVDTCKTIIPPESFNLAEQSIDDLLSVEYSGKMITGENGYDMTLAEWIEVWECYAFTPDDTVSIGKGRSDRKDSIPAERTVIRTRRDIRRLVDLPFQAIRTDPAPETGEMFLTILQDAFVRG
jgi:hypothetical protein